jgi:hypothetical protein
MTAKLHAIQAGPKKADPADLLKTLDDLRQRVVDGDVTGLFWFEVYGNNQFPGNLNGHTLVNMNELEFDGAMLRMGEGLADFRAGFYGEE